MAQLKDTTVSGSLRATDTLYSTKIQASIFNIPTTSNGTTYGPGNANNILISNGTSVYWSATAPKATGDKNGNDIAETYLKLSGGNMTGTIYGNASTELGSVTKPFHALFLGGTTNATMTAASTNPRITFCEGTGIQPVHILYCDYDNYRSPAGLKIVGDSSNSSSPAWLQVEGTVYAASFNGNASSATQFSSNATVTLTGDTTGTSAGSKKSWSIPTTTKKLSQTTTTALSSFTDTTALIYTAAGGSNTITDKPTSVDAFGCLSFKAADGWYGQLLMSSNTATGLYWRTATSLSGGWKKLLDSNNYTDYTVTKTGTGASGTWGIDITGKVNNINFKAVTNESFATGGWEKLNGLENHPSIAIGMNSSSAVWNSSNYSASLVYGSGDTRGLLDLSYNSPIVTFGGTNYAQATVDRPKWYFKLSGTSDKTYTLPSDSKTLAATDGSNATGSWGISITGNAATATNATQDGSGNIITNTYLKKAGDSTTGGLAINASNSYSSYNEGLRINAGARTYATLLLGGTNNSTSGTNDGAFWLGVYNTSSYSRRLMIAHNGSTATNTYFYSSSASQVSPALHLGASGTITNGNADAITGGTVYTALTQGYVTLTTEQTISGRKTFENLAAVTFKPSSGTDKCNINYDSTLGALVFSF